METKAPNRNTLKDWYPTEAEAIAPRLTTVHIIADGYEQKVTFITRYVAAWYTTMVQFIDINNKRYTFMLKNISYIETELEP